MMFNQDIDSKVYRCFLRKLVFVNIKAKIKY